MIKKSDFIIISFIIIAVFALVLSINILGYINKDDKTDILSSSYEVYINGIEQGTVELDTYKFTGIKSGSIVTIETTLPYWEDEKAISFVSRYSAVAVYVDNESSPIYTFGLNDYANGHILGKNYNIFAIPNKYAGKRICIDFYATDNDAFRSLEVPALTSSVSVTSDLFMENIYSYLLSIFLLILGVLLLVVATFIDIINKKLSGFGFIGVFSILVSMWLLCGSNLLQLFGMNSTGIMLMEYFTLYCLDIPMLLYFRTYYPVTDKTVYLIDITFVGNVVLIFVSFGLHFANIAHITLFLPVKHLLFFLSLVCMFIVYVTSKTYRRKSDKLGTLAMLTIILFAVGDLLNYYITLHCGAKYHPIIAYGGFLFIVLLLIRALSELSRAFVNESNKDLLTRLAYEDYLTSLYNRLKVDEILHEYENKNIDYGVVSYDLNYLKEINDTYGHEVGDEYIISFAHILRDYWIDFGKCARVGGDEFMVVVGDNPHFQIQNHARAFIDYLKAKDELFLHRTIETSYGMAFRSEAPCNGVKDVIKLADHRMYDMKRRSHNKQ